MDLFMQFRSLDGSYKAKDKTPFFLVNSMHLGRNATG